MRRWVKAVVAAALVVVAVVGAAVWWVLFRDDAPPEVTLEDAVGQVEDASDGGAGATADDIDGTWTIDTESGDFDFESATGTFAGFRIDEELANIGASTAVGRTGDVSGTFTIEANVVTDARFEVDLTTITTNESRRDGRVQEALETSEFPTATFELTEPIELGNGAASGESVSVTAIGELAVHDVFQEVEIPMEAQLIDGTVVLVGSIDQALADYDVDAPSSPFVLGVSDDFTLELQFLLTRA
jgi:polyisoprenoid-binding protein YceI